MSMENLLSELYKKAEPDVVSGVEKTAEVQMLDTLQSNGQVEENPYADMSDDDFMKLAGQVLNGEEEAEVSPEADEALEKVAADALGGNIMAHSFWNELGLMKTAMVNGKCRVCKTNDMDVEGHSICSPCQATGDDEEQNQQIS